MKHADITTLNCGLPIISSTMPETETVAISLWVGVGSRYEQEQEWGISHFMEHIAFKGTQTRSTRDIAEAFDAIGGQCNACTGREDTVYYARVLKENAEQAIDILADVMQHSVFDPEEIQRERDVVLQELAMTVDTPDDIIFDYYQNVAFSNQPLGRSILGDEAHIRSFDRDDFKAYTQKHYVAKNMALAVAGNIDHQTVCDYAAKYFTQLPKANYHQTNQSDYTGGEYHETRSLEQTHLVFGFPGVSYKDNDLYAVQLLSLILGGGMSSRLFQEIREKRGLAYSVNTYACNYAETGMFSIYAATSAQKTEEVIQVTCEELLKTTQSLCDEEIARAKVQAKASILMGLENSAARADELGRQLMNFGRFIPTHEMIEAIDNISRETLTRIAASLFIDTPIAYATIGSGQNAPSLDNLRSYLKSA